MSMDNSIPTTMKVVAKWVNPHEMLAFVNVWSLNACVLRQGWSPSTSEERKFVSSSDWFWFIELLEHLTIQDFLWCLERVPTELKHIIKWVKKAKAIFWLVANEKEIEQIINLVFGQNCIFLRINEYSTD